METIRCHFDGKVIVPDGPVSLPVNEPLLADVREETGIVDPSNGKPMTVGELRRSGFIGAWAHRKDIKNSLKFARELRERAQRGTGRRRGKQR
jgi:hypothetical protein